MQTLGALPRTVMLIVIGEGIVIAAISWGLALVASASGVLLWLGLVIIGTIGACAVPARRAAWLTIRKTLAYI